MVTSKNSSGEIHRNGFERSQTLRNTQNDENISKELESIEMDPGNDIGIPQQENIENPNINIEEAATDENEIIFNLFKQISESNSNTQFVDKSLTTTIEPQQYFMNTLKGKLHLSMMTAKIREQVKSTKRKTANRKAIENISQLQVRGEGKRAVKPTWKLNEKISTECTKNIIQEHSPQKISSDLEEQKQMSVEPTAITDIEKTEKLKIERKGEKFKTRTRTLYCVKEGDFSNMYYLRKKPQKKPLRDKTSSRKAETIVKSDDRNKETFSEPFRLEDHSNSYSIENYTDLARGLRHKPDEEKQCQRFLCEICKSYRTVMIENLILHIQLHVNGKLDCKSCSFIADSPYNLRCHVNENHHKSHGSLVCELCGAVRCSSDSLKIHANISTAFFSLPLSSGILLLRGLSRNCEARIADSHNMT